MNNEALANVDAREVQRFATLAADWWDPDGSSGPLHILNPVRLGYVERYAELDGLHVLDVGCGGGLLSEAIAQKGASVTAIDMAEPSLEVARRHAEENDVQVDYRLETVESVAREQPGAFSIVTCMEMLEHVPDPQSVISACAQAVRPGGVVVFSTLNRSPKSFALGIVAAEYILGLLPRGTHTYSRFIRPSELARAARLAGLDLLDVSGIAFNPMRRTAAITADPSVNYIAAFRRMETP